MKKIKKSKDDFSSVDGRAAEGCRLKPRAVSGVPGQRQSLDPDSASTFLKGFGTARLKICYMKAICPR